MAEFLDGKRAIDNVLLAVKSTVDDEHRKGTPLPKLAVITNQPDAFFAYGKRSGIDITNYPINQTAGTLIGRLNKDDSYHGIACFGHPAEKEIAPAKDVNCATARNIGLIGKENALFLPPLPAGIADLLAAYGIRTAGTNTTVLYDDYALASSFVPLLLLKKGSNATLTLVHAADKNLGDYTRLAQNLIVTGGKPGLLTPDMLGKKLAVIVDAAGILEEHTINARVVPRQAVTEMAGAIILQNTVKAYSRMQEGRTL